MFVFALLFIIFFGLIFLCRCCRLFLFILSFFLFWVFFFCLLSFWFLIQRYSVAALACIPDWDVTLHRPSLPGLWFRFCLQYSLYTKRSSNLPCFYFVTSFAFFQVHSTSHTGLDFIHMQCLAICCCSLAFWSLLTLILTFVGRSFFWVIITCIAP